MKKEYLKMGIIFFVVVGVVVWGLNFIFLNKNAPKSKATGETMTFTYNPSSVTPAPGTDFTVSLLVKPSINTVLRGYKAKLIFDKAVINFKSIQYKAGIVSAGLGDTDADLTTINNNGSINIVGEDTTSTGYTLTSANGAELVTLTFTAVTNAPRYLLLGDFDFYSIGSDATLSNIWTYAQTGLSINGGVAPTVIPTGVVPTVTPGGPTPTPGGPTITPGGPTPTQGSTGNAKLKLKLKFQGIAGQPAGELNKMSVGFKLLNESTGVITDPQKFADFTADDKGVWSGEVSFDVVSGVKYVVYVKGPFHIQKKVCDMTPTETAGGTYRCASGSIILSVGDNNLDFSGILLLAGDLPVQDGTVSAYDTSLVRNSLGTTDADILSKCDVNRDGKCDTQDYSLIIAALSVKNDEE